VFCASLAACSAPASQVFITHHPAAEDHPLAVARENTSVIEFADELGRLALGQPGVPSDLSGGHRPAIDGQVAVRLALVRDAQHVDPEPARRHAA
jgi:hypothetical protein